MALNQSLLAAGRRAAEVLIEHNTRQRIHKGYTRVDPVIIAQDFEVALMFQPMEKLLGAFIKEERPGIILNVDRPAGLVHMTCAHELGHYFLGHETTADEAIECGRLGTPAEQQADAFAYALLTPQWVLANVMRKKRWTTQQLKNPQTIYQLSLRLGTSYSSAVWSLMRANILTFSVAKTLADRGPKEHKQALLGTYPINNWSADVWHLDEYDHDLIIEPHPDDHFVIDLPSHATAGYLWSADTVAGEGFNVEPILANSTIIPAVSKGTTEPYFGQTVALRCVISSTPDAIVANGMRMPLALVESQPWVGPTERDERFETSTEYELLRRGVSLGEKALLMDSAKGA
jgi:Zn-dependent peptidase ImmA (M78 family)